LDNARIHLLDALPSGALLVDERGRVLVANAHAANVLERARDELVGSPIDDSLASLSWLLQMGALERAKRICSIHLPSGRNRTVGFSMAPAGEGSGGKCYAISFQDVTDWVELSAERDRLMKIAAVGSALPTLLHEIKNPMASITATVEVLIEEMEPGPVRDQIHAVLSEVRRMKLSLDGVAAVGRSLHSQRYAAIDQACRDAWQIMATRGRSLGIYSRCEVDDMPLLLLDPGVVSGIVHNLMNNAIQACTAGQTVNMRAQLMEGGSQFRLTVVDNGPGMTDEVYRHCTELFFTTKRNGSGIGLALCRRAAEEAGGTLTIESVAGFGTSVTLDIPTRPTKASTPSGAADDR
jgi:signal transduction histidine kinase